MKALALFSGGLDSTLAIKLILEQGLEVVALNFKSPFCLCDRAKGCGSSIKRMADQLGVECRMVYLGQEYLEIVKNPQHGYGRNLNPCIDCRILKFRRAKQLMPELGASFLISGEVLGQRPMSQHRQALNTIEKQAGLEGLILRPLSAKLFPPTVAEQKGWVDRKVLLDLCGRTRKPQIKLAQSLAIKDYPCSAGGCLLTDSGFSRRLKDLIEHNEFTLKNVELLKIGRYFRIKPDFCLTVGRDEKENNRLIKLRAQEDIIFEPLDLPGPTSIGRGRFNSEVKDICSRIVARYTAKDRAVKIRIKVSTNGQDELALAMGMTDDEIDRLRIA